MQVLAPAPLTAIGAFLDTKSLCLLQSCNQKLDSDLLEVRTTYIKLWEAVIKLADDGVREDYRQEIRNGGQTPQRTTFMFRITYTRISAFSAFMGLGFITRIPARFIRERDEAQAAMTAAITAAFRQDMTAEITVIAARLHPR